MMESLASADPITRGLAAAALTKGLSAVLLFDVTAEQFASFVATARSILEVTAGPVRQVTVGASESEDMLWGRYEPTNNAEGPPLLWRPGPLNAPAGTEGLVLACIPDLSQLSLPVTRSLVMLLGADVAHVERYGQRARFAPHIFWLAACSSAATARLSVHMLDRFVLRLHPPRLRQVDAVAELLLALRAEPQRIPNAPQTLSPKVEHELQQAKTRWPEFTEEGARSVIAHQLSAPRELALARLAHAFGRLDPDATQVLVSHVTTAARSIGLKPVTEQPAPEPAPPEPQAPDAPSSQKKSNDSPAAPAVAAAASTGSPSVGTTPSIEARVSENVALPAAPIAAASHPYPEDTLPSERDASPLRLPFHRAARERTLRGVILGSEPARDLRDLALVSTLFEAAKFRAVREQLSKDGERPLFLAPVDLRSYRRAPSPEQALVLLLDYTSLDGCQWLEALLPHLKWAYVERATVCLIQVGAAAARHSLRAERRVFASVLVPALAEALELGAGQATPLAHGLELARQTLQHVLQHGRHSAQRARLVVVSDGRGNVPLAASMAGEITGPVSRGGVMDALRSAERLRAIDRREIVFLNPEPRAYPELPLTLARALGAEPRPIARLTQRKVAL